MGEGRDKCRSSHCWTGSSIYTCKFLLESTEGNTIFVAVVLEVDVVLEVGVGGTVFLKGLVFRHSRFINII